MPATSSDKHNFRWTYGGGEVTVTCTKCRESASFNTQHQWEKCIEWCNKHTMDTRYNGERGAVTPPPFPTSA